MIMAVWNKLGRRKPVPVSLEAACAREGCKNVFQEVPFNKKDPMAPGKLEYCSFCRAEIAAEIERVKQAPPSGSVSKVDRRGRVKSWRRGDVNEPTVYKILFEKKRGNLA